jgi:drug/metabolite transporter (DMT)-like permease
VGSVGIVLGIAVAVLWGSADTVATVGYFSLYRGLELGPLAIVSPIVAADGAIAAVLAILLLHERVSAWQARPLA